MQAFHRVNGLPAPVSRNQVELPYYSKYLLVAAYLASYNPAISDKRFFCKVCITMLLYIRHRCVQWLKCYLHKSADCISRDMLVLCFVTVTSIKVKVVFLFGFFFLIIGFPCVMICCLAWESRLCVSVSLLTVAEMQHLFQIWQKFYPFVLVLMAASLVHDHIKAGEVRLKAVFSHEFLVQLSSGFPWPCTCMERSCT